MSKYISQCLYGNRRDIWHRISRNRTDVNHVHFLIQTTPTYSVAQYVELIKGRTANIIFKKQPELKDILYGEEFWSDGYWSVTVSQYGNEEVIRKYVK